MAANPIRDIIELGKRLEVAEGTIVRLASLEQACRETEGRLKSLRDEESKAGASIAAAHAEAKKLVDDAARAAAKKLTDADVECAAKWSECETACLKEEAKSAGHRADIEKQADTKARRVVELEAEEARLGQSVAALRADLATIKARLG